jgi:hypothetical protein
METVNYRVINGKESFSESYIFISMKLERLAFDPRQRQDIEIFSDLPFERNDSSVAPFVAHLLYDAHPFVSSASWIAAPDGSNGCLSRPSTDHICHVGENLGGSSDLDGRLSAFVH